ncbi:hypothetical protein DENSPDRAFT_215417 [Dentipellis sp. KUC8613]|nr:hypothetical protein DENSPDRAFT_215417 [Dentipellis sp. KUC8613]
MLRLRLALSLLLSVSLFALREPSLSGAPASPSVGCSFFLYYVSACFRPRGYKRRECETSLSLDVLRVPSGQYLITISGVVVDVLRVPSASVRSRPLSFTHSLPPFLVCFLYVFAFSACNSQQNWIIVGRPVRACAGAVAFA